VKLKEFPSAESRRRRGPKPALTLMRIWAVADRPMNDYVFMGAPVEHPTNQDLFVGAQTAGAGGAE
jgi:hypothetical protein